MAIVGGGFGGIAAAIMLRREGYEDVTVFEKADRVGGVWNANTYPGIACDVPSHLYELSFAPNPDWSRRYSPGHEIRAYMEDTARRFGVLEDVRLETKVKRATFDEGRGRWRLETDAGAHEADILVAACGQLSAPRVPAIPGLDDFEGPAFHTARWRHDIDLAGKRVAVIGTGCSTIQVVPSIAPEVEQLTIYQRSAGWTLPKLDSEYSPRAKRLFKRFPILQRLDRKAIFAFHEFLTVAMTRQPWLLRLVRRIGQRQIDRAIEDPELRRKVTPTDEFGCKRVMLTDNWYPALTRANVEVVTDAIASVTAGGVRTADGVEREADVIVLGTGFASHSFVAPMEIVGRGGQSLAQRWAGVPKAYLGVTVPSFPNLFMLYGPNTNGGTGSVIHTVEAGAKHVIAAMRELRRANARTIELREQAAEAFDRELREALDTTVWHSGCTSWYVDEQGNNPSQWPWQWRNYDRRCSQLDPAAYELA